MENLVGYIATGVTSFVVGALLMYYRPKANVVFWSPHNLRWLITRDDQNFEFQTDAWTVQNVGRKGTTNLEFVFGREPDHFHLQPSVVHETLTLDNGHFAIRIPTLAPKEVVAVAIFSYENVPEPLTIKSDDGLAESVPIQLLRAPKPWRVKLILLLSALGLGTVAYWLINWGMQFFALLTAAKPT